MNLFQIVYEFLHREFREEPKMSMPKYADLADLPENERIHIMAEYALKGNVISCQTDDDDDKVARYIEKMEAHGVRHISTGPGLVPGTKSISFGPPAKH